MFLHHKPLLTLRLNVLVSVEATRLVAALSNDTDFVF